MNRRGFLSLLGMGAVGYVVAQAVPDRLIWEPARRTWLPDSKLVGIETMTRAIDEEFAAMMAGKIKGSDLTERRVGDVWDGRTFTNQYNVGIMFQPDREFIGMHERYIKPAADALASRVQRERLNIFSALPMPKGGCVAYQGKYIRGVMQPHFADDIMTTRFDLLAGHA